MEQRIKKAGVIGAGVMGATIAAHLANVRIETILLDIVPPKLTDEDKKNGLTQESPEFRNKLAKKGLNMALTSRPASFYLPEYAKRIKVGNLEDNLDWLKEVDWIIEVVVERLDIKKSVFDNVESVLSPGTIISSNTSGLSAKAMCEGRSENFRKHFAITHFFNPPRYMKLLELVPGPDTLPEVMEVLADTCERILGKGIVYAKDTPNFIANRIGIFSMFNVIRTMMELGLSIGAVDKLTGPVIGNPKSASFRTGDLVGLDTLVHVAENVYDGAPDDERRDIFQIPDFIKKMLEKNLLGEKTKQGFYKKTKDQEGKKVILSLDYNTLEYKPQEKVSLPSLEAAKNLTSTAEKIRSLYYAKDVAGQFTFKTMSETFIYAANRIPEIADDIVNVDNAMKWGFGRRLGPFEAWDVIGVAKSVEKMKGAGYQIPAWVEEMLSQGKDSFYRREGGKLFYYDVQSKEYKEVPVKPGIIFLPSLKERNMEIASNPGASLIDLGDGVACLEFHTKMNAMGDDIISMVVKAADIVSERFDGLVIANHADNFSVGANLPLILFTAQEEEWDDLDWMVKTFQDSFMKLKYLDKPVVAAPAGMALGGGCEICLAADRVRYAAETYMGLVEVGVGLIPAGGGTKEMYLRNTEHLFEVQKGGIYPKQIELMPFVARAFETIAMAKVSTSGPEAVKLGYLRPTDQMTVNRDYLIEDAKKTVLAMNMEGYVPPEPKEDIRVAGENTFAMIKLALWTMHTSGYITEHDVTVSEKVGYVLCGGNVQSDTKVSEQYLLDLEREAFLSLCGNPKTQARIQHMLTTGKPLRN
ncbi:MAG: 3-hydroxyacyl-CoA dehydrogenase [Deltaproteobacteria bacterium]|nr:3-hydroxyacyl-CoA dehydrogenase [Deltaproteobacteria bacterium]MBW1930189.1 3-hydroxyacyl-CoA dehydrogenase [Deltaproteobacteria bacterium]MBW2025483.1 3-hydroxyacyl-CoA dehydrogenase [Deltaproteobacteria bacterium]MBW2124974.1 3-hydroxyacyl-CoA dehydrogenase [Deltaproteobacteria bacterium]